MKKAVQKAAAPESPSTPRTKGQSTTKANHQGHHRATPAHPEDRPLPDGLGKSTLTYHVGCTPESVIKIRLYGNTGTAS
jgi:hypothetical protein